MKYLIPILFLSLLISACTPQEAREGFYQNTENGVSFEYPTNWTAEESANGVVVFEADSSELEGTLVYDVVENPEGLTLQDYYKAQYDECMSQPVPEGSDFGPICIIDYNYDDWTQLEIDGNTAYKSDWKGIPESGEMAKNLFVDVDEKNIFLILRAIKTGVTDAESIDTTAENTFASLNIE